MDLPLGGIGALNEADSRLIEARSDFLHSLRVLLTLIHWNMCRRLSVGIEKQEDQLVVRSYFNRELPVSLALREQLYLVGFQYDSIR